MKTIMKAWLKNGIKNDIKNCLATTGLSLLLLTITALLYQAHFLCLWTVFQVLLANIAIHLGLKLCALFESRYFLLEIFLETGYILAVLLLFGCLFDWYTSTPPWVLALLGITVYTVGSCIDIFRLKSDVKIINRKLIERQSGN